jgi:hypothetical protein
MRDEISNKIEIFLKENSRDNFTTPELMKSLKVPSREKIVAAIARLDERGVIETKRRGKTPYYRIKDGS